MIIIKRDNYSLLCSVVAINVTWNEVTEVLEGLRNTYSAEGWQCMWDNELFKKELIVFREGESYSFSPTTRRVPRTRREFVW